MAAITIAVVAAIVGSGAAAPTETTSANTTPKREIAIVPLKQNEAREDMCTGLGVPPLLCSQSVVRSDGSVELALDTEKDARERR